MHLQLITPEKILFEGAIAQVQVPGSEGEFGVLPGHAPTIATLKEGTVGVELASGEKKEFVIAGGVAEVTPERLTLLVASL
jgi:F-type H+-transporting ATPase subunit epsilon